MNQPKDILVQIALYLIIFSLVECKECVKQTACKCSAGKSWGIDLSSLAVGTPPKFSVDIQQLLLNEIKATLYYHPCSDFWVGETDKGACGTLNGTAACVENVNITSGNKTYTNLGIQEFVIFETKPDSNEVKLVYTSGSKGANLTLKCEPDNKIPKLTLDGYSEGPIYQLSLASQCSCPNGCYQPPNAGLSVGSVLLILFFVVVMLYLTVGMLYKYCIMGATGFEIIPNYEFWIDFPFLVRDGILFALNCCKTDAVYDRI